MANILGLLATVLIAIATIFFLVGVAVRLPDPRRITDSYLDALQGLVRCG